MRAVWMAIVCVCWVSCASVESSPDALDASWVDAPQDAPAVELSLRRTSGGAFTGAHLMGRVTLAVFGFTSCPDVCPTTLAGMAPALDALMEDGVPVQAVFIAVDPERDAPVLADYVAHFSPHVVGATADPQSLLAAAEVLGGSFRVWDEGGQTRVEHATSAFVIGPDARVAGYVLHPSRSDEVYEEVLSWWRGSYGALQLTDAWVRPPPPGAQVTAAYGVLSNRSDSAIQIVDAVSEGVRVHLHETYTEHGLTGMRPVQPWIPAGEDLRFEPGGLHFMVRGLPPGATSLPITLILADGREIPVLLPVHS